MTTLRYSQLSNGDYPFDPEVDILRVDILSAAELAITPTTKTTFAGGGKVISLFTGIATLNSQNVVFDDGSVLRIGDDSTETATDDAANTLSGTAHDDQLWGLGGKDQLLGGAGDDDLRGGAAIDTLQGGGGSDRLVGGGGADRLIGDSGDDTLHGGAGDDSLVGGDGDDVYLVDSVGDQVLEVPGGGAHDLVQSSLQIVGLYDEVEDLTLLGTADINGTGNAADNVITGNAGNNRLRGLGGNDSLISGGSGDTLYGGEGDDSLAFGETLYGGAGDDTLRGSGHAGSGDDVLIYNRGWTHDGGSGVDKLTVTSFGDSINLLTDTSLSSIEVIHLSGADHTLKIDAASLATLSGTDELQVLGNSDDTIKAVGLWSNGGLVEIDGVAYVRHSRDGATLLVQTAVNDTSTAILNLTAMDASDGFVLHGGSDNPGSAVAAADIDGDGFADLLVGAVGENLAGEEDAAYLVFGQAEPPAQIDLESLEPDEGFRIAGESANDDFGTSIASNDVNGDGLVDVIVGAPRSGSSYVIFGAGTRAAPTLGALDGNNGFQITDGPGSAVSAGDLNGDGFGDVVIGVPGADGNGVTASGEAYVVFGGSDFSADFELSSLDGTNGFRLAGEGTYDAVGRALATGDINGDGFSDLIVGAPGFGDYGDLFACVIFGKAAGFPANLSVSDLDGTNGFVLDGLDQGYIGSAVSAGDINGDGFDDLIIAGDADDGARGDGHVSVVFGKAGGFGASVDLATLDGTNGFKITANGFAVTGAGDFNGDGFDDIAASGGYVVFGKAGGFDASMSVSSLDGSNGFRLSASSAVSYGDVNGDGFDDLIFGTNGSGNAFVVYGRDMQEIVDSAGTAGDDTVDGGGGSDILIGGLGDDALRGLGGHDVVKGAAGDDGLGGSGGNDRLEGDSGDDYLGGGPGFDRLFGGDGADTLDGGPGSDTLTGGIGSDVFRFNEALAAGDVDVIRDFGGAGAFSMDVIQLDGDVFAGLAAGVLGADNFVKAAGMPAAVDGDDYILYDRDSGALYYDADADGSGAPVQFAVLATDPNALVASDFFVV